MFSVNKAGTFAYPTTSGILYLKSMLFMLASVASLCHRKTVMCSLQKETAGISFLPYLCLILQSGPQKSPSAFPSNPSLRGVEEGASFVEEWRKRLFYVILSLFTQLS